jgi:parallel beta-helix repeat protein
MIFASLLIVAVFSSIRLAVSQTEQELYYDDGVPEGSFFFAIPGGMAAVRFTPPATCKLIGCRFEIWNTTTVKVHVMDANRRDLITPFLITLTSDVWNSANLTKYGIIVSADFYIGIEWVTGYTCINRDTSSPDNRSWHYLNGIWTQWTESDYLIRATIETGGESGTTYILADGTIWGSAPLLRDGNYYTLFANYYGSIVVQRDNIVLDGAGYWLQGSGISNSRGIYLFNKSNVIIRNIGIRAFNYGIFLNYSSYNIISENNVRENMMIGIAVMNNSGYNRISENKVMNNTWTGILLQSNSNNTIITNNVRKNGRYGIYLKASSYNNMIASNSTANVRDGIVLEKSSYNTIIANNITDNVRYGIVFVESSDNTIYHNNFINNTRQVYNYLNVSKNIWDDGYPSGGNYWSDNVGPTTELYYDDGFPEEGWAWSGPGCMDAVRFTPSITGQLMNCSFYIYLNATTVKVHVMDQNRRDAITPFVIDGTDVGWWNVSLSGYRVTISASIDFYIAIEWTAAYRPWLGADLSAPDGRSWDFNGAEWTQVTTRDYLIRATVETGMDLKSGPNQDLPGSDGIGDTPYVIDANNRDKYPLMIPRIRLTTDLNNDGVVNIIDIALVAKAYGTRPGDKNWNPIADVAESYGEIDIIDIAMVARDFGRTY